MSHCEPSQRWLWLGLPIDRNDPLFNREVFQVDLNNDIWECPATVEPFRRSSAKSISSVLGQNKGSFFCCCFSASIVKSMDMFFFQALGWWCVQLWVSAWNTITGFTVVHVCSKVTFSEEFVMAGPGADRKRCSPALQHSTLAWVQCLYCAQNWQLSSLS